MIIDPSSASTLEKIAEKRAAERPPSPNAIVNFGIEYSTSSENNCFVCQEPIYRSEIRIKKVVYEGEIAERFGKEIRWSHIDCFIMKRDLFGFEVSGYQLPGLKSLNPDHQIYVKEALP